MRGPSSGSVESTTGNQPPPSSELQSGKDGSQDSVDSLSVTDMDATVVKLHPPLKSHKR